MYTATVTSKGQVTIPVRMRRDLGLRKTDKVVFSKKNGDFVMEKLPSVDSVFGSLANPNIKPYTNAQIKKSIEKGMFSKNDFT